MTKIFKVETGDLYEGMESEEFYHYERDAIQAAEVMVRNRFEEIIDCFQRGEHCPVSPYAKSGSDTWVSKHSYIKVKGFDVKY